VKKCLVLFQRKLLEVMNFYVQQRQHREGWQQVVWWERLDWKQNTRHSTTDKQKSLLPSAINSIYSQLQWIVHALI